MKLIIQAQRFSARYKNHMRNLAITQTFVERKSARLSGHDYRKNNLLIKAREPWQSEQQI